MDLIAERFQEHLFFPVRTGFPVIGAFP